jgi:hypothetical protein
VGGVALGGDDAGYRLTLIANRLSRENRMFDRDAVLGVVRRQQAFDSRLHEVVVSVDRENVVVGLGRARIDVLNVRVGVLTPEDGEVDRMRVLNVVGVPRVTCE